MPHSIPTNSPWGKVEYSEDYQPGVAFVHSASHGGICFSADVARRLLSTAARERAIFMGGHYFFEEDCKIAIALFEVPALRLLTDAPGAQPISEALLLQSIKQWNPDYLLERGDLAVTL